MEGILTDPVEIRKRIAQKDPFELCLHEIRWLIVHDLFGEEYDKGIFATSTLPIRIYRWYQQHNPRMVQGESIEEFTKRFVKDKMKGQGIATFGFKKLGSSYKNRQNIRHLLIMSGEAITDRPSAFTLWTYSHGLAVKKLEDVIGRKKCGDLNCVICGGLGHRERIKAITAMAGMFLQLYGSRYVKLMQNLYREKLAEFNGDFEEFLKWCYSQRYGSIVHNPEEYVELLSELEEEIEG